jgi:hypothetical protein
LKNAQGANFRSHGTKTLLARIMKLVVDLIQK